MDKFKCPTCGHETEQLAFVIDVGHECPQRPARNKVSTFVRIGRVA